MSIKHIAYFILINTFIFLVLEFSSGLFLKYFSPQTDLRSNMNPTLEMDGDLLRTRRNPFSAKTLHFPIKYEKAGRTFFTPIGKISFNSKEGMIRNAFGDQVINQWGFRGPFFERAKAKGVYRIMFLGSSIVNGTHENELTSSRILERMLNDIESPYTFEVINAGVTGHNLCDVKSFYFKDIKNFNPDIVLILSGHNDANKLRNKEIRNVNHYCHSEPFYKKWNIFRLRTSLWPARKANETLGYKIIKKNIDYYSFNLEKIINHMKTKNKIVALITLPTIMEASTSPTNLKKKFALKNIDVKEIDYLRQVIIEINHRLRMLADKYSNVFTVNNPLSINSEGKRFLIAGTVHPSGEGERLLAYGAFKSIVNKLNLASSFEKPYSDDQKISKNQLEIEYLKSIFVSNNIEDISSAGCVTLHQRCTHRQEDKHSRKLDFINGIVSFTLGSILQFHNQIIEDSNFLLLEQLLLKSIQMEPEYSLPKWILGNLYFLNNKPTLASIYKSEAEKNNPLLKRFIFSKQFDIFRTNHKSDPLIKNFYFLHKTLKKLPNYVGAYHYFRGIPLLIKAKKYNRLTKFVYSFYISSPLLKHSLRKFLAENLLIGKESTLEEFSQKYPLPDNKSTLSP